MVSTTQWVALVATGIEGLPQPVKAPGFTRDEWHRYFADEPYRRPCP
ncbi:MAG TPA: hypothetical protein VFZ70_00590 [Euzebyales bacterium]